MARLRHDRNAREEAGRGRRAPRGHGASRPRSRPPGPGGWGGGGEEIKATPTVRTPGPRRGPCPPPRHALACLGTPAGDVLLPSPRGPAGARSSQNREILKIEKRKKKKVSTKRPRERRAGPALPFQLLVQSPTGGCGAAEGGSGGAARRRGRALGSPRPQRRGLRGGSAGRGARWARPPPPRAARCGLSEGGGREADATRTRRRRPRRPRWEVSYKAAARPDRPTLVAAAPGSRAARAVSRSERGDRADAGQTQDGPATPARPRLGTNPGRFQSRTDAGPGRIPALDALQGGRTPPTPAPNRPPARARLLPAGGRAGAGGAPGGKGMHGPRYGLGGV